MTRKGDTRTRKSGGVTMSTIATMAGVTQATVSRALNHPEVVSPATLDRIRAAIQVTGYVPNLVAGALASSKSRMVAVVVPSITNIVYSALIHHFIDLVRDAGYQTILVESGFSASEEEALVTALISRRPDGILLTGVHHTAQCRSLLLSAGLPVVEIWDLTQSPIDICVGFSHADAGSDVARFASSLRYTNAAVIAADDERARRRKAAFCKTYQDLGFDSPREVCVDGAASIGGGRRALRALLDQGMQNGVIFCSSDLLAHGVLIETQSRGLSVPGDFGVIGFGDQDYAADLVPPLTSVRVDRSVLGRKAADALLARIAGITPDTHAFDVGFRIIPRGTT
ncbi:LacI family DNA-binding transcriptional regulator [Pseudoruegeria sp. SK021]|uniref:LacI family DNA-binding transcriptional regulator n=1 Tax=Pseudoruegeria sp. SK021 TaxID=1933035 RepID=UPI000A21FCD3|nr:LacI family DNA-binding transcriptional regulator [Pseudoruegeria sp. SK021]OSP55922.1 LacI family transcriptional regulator [Pseudoruegeria sp. SK021]